MDVLQSWLECYRLVPSSLGSVWSLAEKCLLGFGAVHFTPTPTTAVGTQVTFAVCDVLVTLYCGGDRHIRNVHPSSSLENALASAKLDLVFPYPIQSKSMRCHDGCLSRVSYGNAQGRVKRFSCIGYGVNFLGRRQRMAWTVFWRTPIGRQVKF